MTFREVAIGELERDGCFVSIQDGNHGEKHPKATDYVDEGVPFIMASDIRYGWVDVENANKLPQSITDNLRIGFCRGGDVLLSHKGSVGYVAIAPEHLPYLMLTPQVTYYRVNHDKLSADFLNYAFRDPMFQRRLASAAGQQGTRGYVGITAQRRLLVRYGDRACQDRLVAAIKPYDDLIENNRRRIALLEEALRLFYREWFVCYRFPGHEHVKVIEGVPSGWTRYALSDLADFVNGYPFEPSELGDTGLPIVKIPELKEGVTDKTPRNSGELIPEKYHLKDGDLLFSWSGTLAANVWAGGLGLLNQHLFHVVPTDRVGRGFLLCAIRHALLALGSHTVGATMKHIRRSALDNVYVALPDNALMSGVEETLNDIYKQLTILHQQNNKLAQARDLLLPRLMNGEIAA